MKKLNLNKLRQYLPFFLLALAVICCNLAIADVGNNNRYDSGGGFDGGDSDFGAILWLIYMCIRYPYLIPIVIVIGIVLYIINKKKKNPLIFSGLSACFVGTVGLEPTTPAL